MEIGKKQILVIMDLDVMMLLCCLPVRPENFLLVGVTITLLSWGGMEYFISKIDEWWV